MLERLTHMRLYLVPLLILAGLFLALHWIPTQLALEWLMPVAAAILPAWIPALHIVIVIAMLVGGAFALAILWMTRTLHRRVLARERVAALDAKRRHGHESIAAAVFDPGSIALLEDDPAASPGAVACALEGEVRLVELATTLWGKPEFDNFARRLLRGEDGAASLHPEVRGELAFLADLRCAQSAPPVSHPPRRTVAPEMLSHRGAAAFLLLFLLLVPVY